MRLYNQNSRSPMQSSYDKKWSRPKTYLPQPREAIDDPRNQSDDNENGQVPLSNSIKGSSLATSHVDDSKLRDTHFLFDIDEEISMTSSSTLSTHTTLQQDQQTSCRLGLAKPFPGFGKPAKAPRRNEDNPFEVIRSSASHKKKLCPPKPHSSNGVSRVKTPKKHTFYIDQHSLPTPEMTLTDSSSEESHWMDFASCSFSSNPFRSETRETEQEIQFSSISNNFSVKAQEVRRSETNPDFPKYSAMMIHGSSVAEVTKIMAEDQIDPKIISLVMIAASEAS